MKYRPTYPERFGSFEDAHALCGRFFPWYNDEHRALVLEAAYAAHPERFVRRVPTPPALPQAVWINEPEEVVATPQ